MKEQVARFDSALSRKQQKQILTDKTVSLSEAIGKYVKPGQSILVGEKPAYPTGYPTALLNELIRQFYGKNPRFTFISYGGYSNTLVPLLAGNMVSKVISTFMGDPYPAPSPNPVIQKAFAEKQVEFEQWTMLTLTLRLMAAALDLPFFPTKSLLGSSLAENNPGFVSITDPFENDEIGLVRPLIPDLCFIHGWLADCYGNTVLNYPLGGNVYGPLAAREGIIVSTEKIVSTEEIMRYREYIRLPADMVKAVVEAPFGSHPAGHNPFPHDSREGYAEDLDFILEARRVCRNRNNYLDWIRKWILECPDHEQYLKMVGRERLEELRAQMQPSYWKTQLKELETVQQPEPTPEEALIVTAARYIEKLTKEKEIRQLLTGIGASHLACWLAYYKLLEANRHVVLMTENGLYGYVPLPGDPYLFSNRNIPTGEMYADILHILGIVVQGAPGRCLGVLGAAEIDQYGNINSSQIPESSLYLVGSGGSNDVASGAKEVIAVVKQSKKRFLEEVSFVTSPGTRVSALVSQFGIFRKDTDGKLKLAAYLKVPDLDEKQAVERIRSQCGWPLELWPRLEPIQPPTPDELALLRLFDPKRFFLG